MKTTARNITEQLAGQGVQLTLGGEPSYVPIEPVGAEWNITAVGPTKLQYAWDFADALIADSIQGGVVFFSPGKSFPGEMNPRWALHILWNRDGSPIYRAGSKCDPVTQKTVENFKHALIAKLRLKAAWIPCKDPASASARVFALPLDHVEDRWITDSWPLGRKKSMDLAYAEGPAGLRLPLNSLPPDALKRALILETRGNRLYIFFPPLMQAGFLKLLNCVEACLASSKISDFRFEGYIPGDDRNLWSKLSFTPDPGVLEVNLPPCASAAEYTEWMERLEKSAHAVGLRSYKQLSPQLQSGTGGGNHLLFGAPDLESNPFFRFPGWITSMLRYWQHHPSLSYLFTGEYVGPSSQAPRPDESGRELYDLEMAYRFLENLEPGCDQRYLISETLRHLHTDSSGNTHRSEVSFDKFWNTAFSGGCRGLIEFRAIETLPCAKWMGAVALLWQALAAFLFENPFRRPLTNHDSRIHDLFFLPSAIWVDFRRVLRDLRNGGFKLDESIFEAIWNWRFPQMLAFEKAGSRLSIRRALEGWPLLCETPLEGGNTSRFVDTSMERIELLANQAFSKKYKLYAQGRELKLENFPGGKMGIGLRYRRSALYPSLHPGITPHIPLFVVISNAQETFAFRMGADQRAFSACDINETPPRASRPCKKLQQGLITCDLRIP